MNKTRLLGMALILIIILSMSACSDKENKDSAQESNTSTAIENNNDWEDNFIKELANQGFLQPQIVKDLPDFREENEADGGKLYLWSLWDKNKDDFVHNVQMVSRNNILINYHYKNYSYDVPHLKEPMLKEKASKMVEEFANQFLTGEDKLSFKNDPNKQIQSVYDPGHVEAWISGEHVIVVDLDMGNIIYYSFGDI